MNAKRFLIVVTLLMVAISMYTLTPWVLRAQEITPESTAEAKTTTCNVPFEAMVRQGPSSGTDFKGTLQVTIDTTGAIKGNLVIDANTGFPVYGQVNGRAINLALNLRTTQKPDVYVFGVGTVIDPIQSKTCGTILGGPFVGPMPGDRGDWDSTCGGVFTTKLPSSTKCSDITDKNTGVSN